MKLEGKGWKGDNNSALESITTTKKFFIDALSNMAENNKLAILQLTFNSQPISMQIIFIGKNGSFAYKTAYNEDYAKYSPGALLEEESINCLLSHPQIQWMDSCSQPGNSLEQIWSERRKIESINVSFPNALSRVTVKILKLLRKIKQAL